MKAILYAVSFALILSAVALPDSVAIVPLGAGIVLAMATFAGVFSPQPKKTCPRVEHTDGSETIMSAPRWTAYQQRAAEIAPPKPAHARRREQAIPMLESPRVVVVERPAPQISYTTGSANRAYADRINQHVLFTDDERQQIAREMQNTGEPTPVELLVKARKEQQ